MGVGVEGRRAKNGPKCEKIMSVVLCISGIIYCMISGTQVLNDDISMHLSCFQNFDFWVC